jgi:hypothetical protein
VRRVVLASVGLLGAGACLLYVALAAIDLRFASCNGYYRFDAPKAYCRQPGYFWVAALATLAAGTAGLVLAGIWRLRRPREFRQRDK